MTKPKTQETKDIYIRVPSEMKDKLNEVKNKSGLSINTIVLNCIKRQLLDERK